MDAAGSVTHRVNSGSTRFPGSGSSLQRCR